jgi:pumilio family protein 6
LSTILYLFLPNNALTNLPIPPSIYLPLQKDLGDFVGHKAAHRIFLQILNPDCPRYLPPSLSDLMHPAEKILTQAGGASKDEDTKEEAENEEEDGEEEEEEEEGVGAAQKLSAGPLGVSKKDPFLRRKELLDGGLGQVLVTLCAESGADLIIAQHAGDVVGEVCRGGNDGVLEAVVGAEAIDAVHAAIVEAAGNSLEEENEGVLGSYFGSRVVRRLILSSSEDGPAGKIAQRFTQELWNKALKGKCKQLHESHAAKVLAAVVHCGVAKVVKEATAELKKAGVKDVQGWATTFLKKS